MPLHKFNVLNRGSNDLQFTATIDCDETASPRIKLGLAVRYAYLIGANLRDADLRGANLRDADLIGADLSDADLRDADLRDANLRGAYLIGADLSDADLRDADLSGADLRDANLRDANLRDAYLIGANLRDADLRDANLRGAYLIGAYLIGANLSDAYLIGANLRDAYLRDADLSDADLSDANLRDADLRVANLSGAIGANLRDAPAIPALDSKILAAIEAGGKLDMTLWHSCETTHCRAGWAITLAGDEGRKLEDEFGSAAAGAMIYAKSYPDMKIPNFYATNKEAMEDMRARAAQDPKVPA